MFKWKDIIQNFIQRHVKLNFMWFEYNIKALYYYVVHCNVRYWKIIEAIKAVRNYRN